MLIVTCALIEHAGSVLITQRSETMSLPFMWEFPGGKLDPGETLEECIKREIQEELLVAISLLERLPSCIHTYPEKSLELIPFRAKISQGTLTLTEHLSSAWVDADSVEKYELAPADKKVWQLYQKHLIS